MESWVVEWKYIIYEVLSFFQPAEPAKPSPKRSSCIPWCRKSSKRAPYISSRHPKTRMSYVVCFRSHHQIVPVQCLTSCLHVKNCNASWKRNVDITAWSPSCNHSLSFPEITQDAYPALSNPVKRTQSANGTVLECNHVEIYRNWRVPCPETLSADSKWSTFLVWCSAQSGRGIGYTFFVVLTQDTHRVHIEYT